MALGRKTGGRQKGALNKDRAAREAKIKASGDTPLEYLVGRMQDEGEDQAVRIDCAKAAAPYLHARLATTEVKAEVAAVVTYITKVDGGL